MRFPQIVKLSAAVAVIFVGTMAAGGSAQSCGVVLNPGDSIQSAVNQATVVCLNPGTYEENFFVGTVQLANTIVGLGSNATNVTIRGAQNDTPVIVISNHSLTIQNLRVAFARGICSSNTLSSCAEGVLVDYGASVLIQGSFIQANGFDGVGVVSNGKLTIQNSTVNNNNGAGVRILDQGNVDIESSVLDSNENGLDVRGQQGSEFTIEQSFARNNKQEGISLTGRTQAYVVNNPQLSNNGGFGFWAGAGIIENCSGNSGSGNGAGLYGGDAVNACR